MDILDTFPEIKIAVAYHHGGKKLDSFPGASLACQRFVALSFCAEALSCATTADMRQLAEVEVEYITLPGWLAPISHARKFDDLPANAQAYVRTIERLTGIPGTCAARLLWPRSLAHPLSPQCNSSAWASRATPSSVCSEPSREELEHDFVRVIGVLWVADARRRRVVAIAHLFRVKSHRSRVRWAVNTCQQSGPATGTSRLKPPART
eukprot:Opistho-1_new@73043